MTQWWFDGVNLDQIFGENRWSIENLSGAEDMAAVRGENPEVPLREGRTHVTKYYEQRTISLGMNIAGKVPIDFQSRLDVLKLLFGSRTQKVLKRQMADGTFRQANAEVTGTIGFDQLRGDHSGRFVVDFLLADPFMRSDVATAPAATTIDASPKTFTITNPGTAEDRSMIISLTGPLTNPRVDNLTNGTWVSFTGVASAGQVLVINVANFTAIKVADNVLDNILHAGDSYFFVLIPGDNSISVTSDVTTTGTVGFSFNAPYH